MILWTAIMLICGVSAVLGVILLAKIVSIL